MDYQFILITIAALALTGCVAAVILYFVSQKFKVYEDPRIGKVEEVLPGANCGGCGFPGCHGMAEALVKADDLSTLMCPVGGAATMSKVAAILGKEAGEVVPKVAVVRCAGTCENRPKNINYDGAKSCAIESSHFSGETSCSYGCLGDGDCEAACQFDAIHINKETGLPEVDETKCVACGACVKACPRRIIELRVKDVNVISCVNKDKGAVAMKACKASCIGCGKCASVCGFEAIKVENNVAYIDYMKCQMCHACEEACPKGLIHIASEPLKLAKSASSKTSAKSESADNAPKAAPLVAKGPVPETFSKNRISQYYGNTNLKSENPTPVPTPISAEDKVKDTTIPEAFSKNRLSMYYNKK